MSPMSPLSSLPPLPFAGPDAAGLTGLGSGTTAGPADAGPDFGRLLLEAVGRVDGLEKNANQQLLDHLAGNGVTQAEALSAFQQADMAVRLMLQVRNKLLEAFNEVKQMGI